MNLVWKIDRLVILRKSSQGFWRKEFSMFWDIRNVFPRAFRRMHKLDFERVLGSFLERKIQLSKDTIGCGKEIRSMFWKGINLLER